MAEPTVQTPPAPQPRVSLIANPVPVGVGGFALTTFTLGLYTTGMFHAGGAVLVLVLAAFYGGLTQFLAGFFALAKGELFSAAFMTSYGAFWFTYVGLLVYVVPRAAATPVAAGGGPAAASQAVVIFLIMWTVITLIFTISTLGTNWFVFGTFVVFDIALILAIVGADAPNVNVTKASGYAELVLAAMAWYIVGGEIANATLGRNIFPFFPIMRRRAPARTL